MVQRDRDDAPQQWKPPLLQEIAHFRQQLMWGLRHQGRH
jgi:hypothetical protein